MKISNVSIKFIPNADESFESVYLLRDENREWYVQKLDGTKRGLFPSEVRIVSQLQEIIKGYNGLVKE